MLSEAIPRVIARAGISEPAYCGVLGYSREAEAFLPPAVGVGLDRERQTWRREHGRRVKDIILNPAEFSHFATPTLTLNGGILGELCAQANVVIRHKHRERDAIQLLNQVAGDLAAGSWRGILATTEDFLVYATDDEGVDLKRNLTAVYGRERVGQLRADGWL